ncbi:hypothetical protein AB4Y43_01110 [Paraburkholderia sp. BR10872]|uniref:hypothetical protein n=1 Tax=Paraburkholderia sp. BR10872 TaxID=3236989 RepID=UPI0034D2D337
MTPVVRICIHLMDDPSHRLISETEHDLTVYEDAGGSLKAYVDYHGSILPVPVESAVLERWFAKDRREAVV